uniref:Uncharacterized protein MANES_05G073300 n=1 Tax=Rhizophora mucronata TaxID=61149 RepID=A0A2P2LN64_RHIMU
MGGAILKVKALSACNCRNRCETPRVALAPSTAVARRPSSGRS